MEEVEVILVIMDRENEKRRKRRNEKENRPLMVTVGCAAEVRSLVWTVPSIKLKSLNLEKADLLSLIPAPFTLTFSN